MRVRSTRDAEAAVLESEAAVLEADPRGVLVLAPGTGLVEAAPEPVCVRVNAAAARLLDTSTPALRGARLREVLPPALHRVVLERLGTTPLRAGASPRVEVEVPTRAGPRVLAVQVAPLERGHVVWLWDVTAEHQEHAQLERSRALLLAVIQGSPDAVFAKDLAGRYTLVNDAAARMLGAPAERILGRTDRELLPAAAARATAANDRAILASPRPLTYEDAEPLPRGRVWLSTRGVLREEGGRPYGLFGICRDITARKRREEAAAAEAQLRKRMVDILAHDLGTPLACARLSTEVLLQDAQLPAADRRAAELTAESLRRASDLTTQLLELARLRLDGGMALSPDRVDLGALCRSLIAELQVSHPDRPVKLRIRGQGTGWWDAGRLAQGISNLIGNALEHGEGPVRVSAWEEGDVQVLEVHNRGPVIPEAQQATLFTALSRHRPPQPGAPRRPHTSGGGLGLGLYVVHAVAEAHGGEVSVRSSEEEGTTFTLRLPRRAERAPGAQAPAPRAPAAPARVVRPLRRPRAVAR